MYAMLALDLELTVAEENIGRLDVPVNDQPRVQERYRRHELLGELDRARLVNRDTILPTKHTQTRHKRKQSMVTADRLPACLSAQVEAPRPQKIGGAFAGYWLVPRPAVTTIHTSDNVMLNI